MFEMMRSFFMRIKIVVHHWSSNQVLCGYSDPGQGRALMAAERAYSLSRNFVSTFSTYLRS